MSCWRGSTRCSLTMLGDRLRHIRAPTLVIAADDDVSGASAVERGHRRRDRRARACTSSRAAVITFRRHRPKLTMPCCESFSALMPRETIVTDHAKGTAMVLGPEEGESFWQPLPSTGYVINKFNPYNSPYDTFSTGLQVLEPGAHVRRHAHERSHELLFCYRGTGEADIEGKLYDILPRNDDPDRPRLAAQGHEYRHGADASAVADHAAGPGGLVCAIGRPRRTGEPLPAPFDRPAHVEAIQAQQRFIRPVKD